MDLPEIYNYLSFSEVNGRLTLKCIRNKNNFCERNTEYLLAFIGFPFIRSINNSNQKLANLTFCIEKYNRSISELANSLDGSFLMVFIDFKLDLVHFINDRLGVYPFFYNVRESNIFGSIHSDEVGSNISNKSLDMISLGEFLKVGTISPGYSFYKDIKSLDYGTVFTFNRNTRKSTIFKYFNPNEISKKPYLSLNEAYKNMFFAMKFLKDRYKNSFKKIGVLLSGGLDSRAIAIFLKDNFEAITLSTFNNRSRKITIRIASLLGIKLHVIPLVYDQYINLVDKSVFLSGGMSNFTDNHFASQNTINKLKEYDLLLSGCYFDYIFKSLGSNSKAFSLFGIKFPFLIELNKKISIYRGAFEIEKNLSNLVDKRRLNRFRNIKNKNLIEFRRVAPLSLEAENIYRRSLFMFSNWNPFVVNYLMIKVMLKTPVNLKLNARLIRELLFKNSGNLRFVPNANTGVPIYPNVYFDMIHRIMIFLIFKFKCIVFKSKSSKEIHGSWLFSKEYVGQNQIEEIFFSINSKEKEIIKQLLGKDIWKIKDYKGILEQYNHNFIVRIITLSKWLELRRKSLLFSGI